MDEDDMLAKGWLPDGVTQGDLDDGDFAWLSDAYTSGKQRKSEGRKLPYEIHGTVNADGWKAAWSRAHQDSTDFSGGPTQAQVIAVLLKHKPAGVDTGKSDGPLLHKMCATPDLKFFGDDGGAGSMSGYLSAFGNIDRGGEIVVRGAFSKHLDTFLKDGFIALNHNWDVLPIATVTEAHEDDFGLHFTADFHSTPAAQEARTVARERIARGKSVSTSIGYKVADSERTDSALLLKDLPLYEGSIVNVPMNPLPTIGMVKGWASTRDEEDAAPLAGMPFAAATDAALATVEDVIARAKAIIDLRAKEGRMLSGANVARLDGMRVSLRDHADALDAMIAMAAPKAAPKAAPAPDMAAARIEHARYLLWQAQQLGVRI